MHKKYSVTIVDDHELISKGISGLINEFEEFEVIHQLKNGRELVKLFSDKKNVSDIVLLDINMPVMNGFETMEWIGQHLPELPTLALTINNDDDSVIKMLKLGVKGYLLKDSNSEELHTAMLTILNKGFYSSDIINNKLINNFVKNEKKDNIVLKPRELEFLEYACSDLTYIEIAEKMFLSPKTVDHYRDELFSKFQVKSRIGLVIFAIKNNLINL